MIIILDPSWIFGCVSAFDQSQTPLTFLTQGWCWTTYVSSSLLFNLLMHCVNLSTTGFHVFVFFSPPGADLESDLRPRRFIFKCTSMRNADGTLWKLCRGEAPTSFQKLVFFKIFFSGNLTFSSHCILYFGKKFCRFILLWPVAKESI